MTEQATHAPHGPRRDANCLGRRMVFKPVVEISTRVIAVSWQQVDIWTAVPPQTAQIPLLVWAYAL
jgi:hypothetical protein